LLFFVANNINNSFKILICETLFIKITNIITRHKQLIYFRKEIKLRTIKDKNSKKKYCKFLNQCSNSNNAINDAHQYALILKRLLKFLLTNLNIFRYSNLIIAFVSNVYEDNKAITILSINKIDEIDKEFKFNLKKFI